MQNKEQRLCAPHAKRWNDEFAGLSHTNIPNDALKNIAGSIFIDMHPPAVGTLTHEVIDLGKWNGILEQRILITTNISAKGDATNGSVASLYLQNNVGSTQ